MDATIGLAKARYYEEMDKENGIETIKKERNNIIDEYKA